MPYDWSRRSFLGAAAEAALFADGRVGKTELRLQRSDNRLMWAGAVVRPSGVAMGDVLEVRANRPTSDYRIVANSLGSTIVRLSVHPNYWRNKRSAVIDTLQRDVEAALANRVWVIIDWHTIGWPDGYSQDDSIYLTSWELCENFWTDMANRFGSDGRIAFELWNEPVSNPDAWPPRGPQTWSTIRKRWHELIAIIRQRSRNMVICTGDHWAFDLRGIRDNPIDDGNTAYAWHVYAGHEANDPARWAERLDDLHLEHPVIVTEWGFCSKTACKDKHYYGTAQTFGRNFVKFMDERYLPWTAWVWVPWWGDLNLVASDWRSLTEWGMFVKNALAQGQQSRP